MISLFRIFPHHLIGIAFMACVPLAPAASVVVASYSYGTSPSSSYPDSGGEMTDGITYSLAWTVPSTPIGLADVENLTGWQNQNPTIQFNFTTASNVESVTVWAADSDGSAGVGLPVSILLRTPDNTFSQTFFITNPSGNGSTVPLVLSGFSVNTSALIVEAQSAHQWTMLSEVQFDSVPEPSSLVLLGVALAGFVFHRRGR